MKIPKSFKLFATTITVIFDNRMMNEKQRYGEARYSQSQIVLAETDNHERLSEDKMLDTFYHEKIHSILDAMNERDLSSNEKFVDVFAKLLRQSDETSVYENS